VAMVGVGRVDSVGGREGRHGADRTAFITRPSRRDDGTVYLPWHLKKNGRCGVVGDVGSA